MSTPGMYSFFYVKVPKTAKKVVWWSDFLRKGHSLRGQALYKGQKIVCLGCMGFMSIKKSTHPNVHVGIPNQCSIFIHNTMYETGIGKLK
jgi:hypothetical protein